MSGVSQACWCCQREGMQYSGGQGTRLVTRIVCEQCRPHRCMTHEMAHAGSGKCQLHCPICVALNMQRLAEQRKKLNAQRKTLDISLDTERKVE